MRISTLAVVVLANLVSGVAAQCSLVHTSLGAFAGTTHMFTDAVVFDPDGTGPLTPRLVCAAFNTNHSGGGPTALGIAAFDEATSTWSTFGSGIVQGFPLHLAVGPGGELVLAGEFGSVDGVAISNIARWTGSAFAPLGGGVASPVAAMKVAPNGDLVVLAGTSVSRWDGAQWTPLGTLPSTHTHLAVAANGDIVVSSPQTGFMLWTGSNWIPHAPGMGSVGNLAFMPNGDLFAAGVLPGQPIHHRHFAVWDGTAWTPLGTGWNFPFGQHFVSDILFLPNGDPVVGGQIAFFIGTSNNVGPPYGALRWNGTSWLPFLPAAQVRALAFGSSASTSRTPRPWSSTRPRARPRCSVRAAVAPVRAARTHSTSNNLLGSAERSAHAVTACPRCRSPPRPTASRR